MASEESKSLRSRLESHKRFQKAWSRTCPVCGDSLQVQAWGFGRSVDELLADMVCKRGHIISICVPPISVPTIPRLLANGSFDEAAAISTAAFVEPFDVDELQRTVESAAEVKGKGTPVFTPRTVLAIIVSFREMLQDKGAW